MPTSTDILSTASTASLPDIPGKVHGIKSLGPTWSVQCDDCLTVFSGEWLLGVAKSATFNAKAETPGLRLCSDCWAARGWHEGFFGMTYRAN